MSLLADNRTPSEAIEYNRDYTLRPGWVTSRRALWPLGDGCQRFVTKFEAIDEFLGNWVNQLSDIRSGDEYATIVSELESPADSGFGEHLPLLDEHLSVASQSCLNFRDLLGEKAKLPSSIHEANATVLNKLGEIRAVVGLSRLGFGHIQFSGTPDLTASKDGQPAAIEVTRLGRSEGRRSDVWDVEVGAENLESLEEVGYHAGLMTSGGKVEGALSEAIYREIEEKYRQIRDADAHYRIIWISLGRDYLTCNKYELEGMGLFKSMSRTAASTAAQAVQSHREAGLCELLTHVVICPGRNLKDIVVDTGQ